MVNAGRASAARLRSATPGRRRPGATPRSWRVERRTGGAGSAHRRRSRRPAAATRAAAGVTIRSLGPLGLAARQRTRDAPWTVRVLPPFTSRRLLPDKLARLRELDGSVTTAGPRPGQRVRLAARLRRRRRPPLDRLAGDRPSRRRRRPYVAARARPAGLLVLDTGRTAAGRVGGAPAARLVARRHAAARRAGPPRRRPRRPHRARPAGYGPVVDMPAAGRRAAGGDERHRPARARAGRDRCQRDRRPAASPAAPPLAGRLVHRARARRDRGRRCCRSSVPW